MNDKKDCCITAVSVLHWSSVSQTHFGRKLKQWKNVQLNAWTKYKCRIALQWPIVGISFFQCDQIGRFFALWATIQSWWQQLFYPNCLHCQAIFVKLSKSSIFLVKSYLGNFYAHLAILIWSHCVLLRRQSKNRKSLIQYYFPLW